MKKVILLLFLESRAKRNIMDIYTKKVIELASVIPFSERLYNPSISVTKRTPVCGSKITIDMTVSGGKVSRFGQQVNACALGQASATIVTRNVIGTTHSEMQTLHTTVKEMLNSDGPIPDRPFQDFEALTPARNYKNRHASILLILDSILEGFHKLNLS